MPQPQTAPQYLDDNGEPIGAPQSAPALTYLDDDGNPTGPMKPLSVADQARKRLAARGLTPADVKAGGGVSEYDAKYPHIPGIGSVPLPVAELQNPANFPTTGEVLSSVGEHALGAVKQFVPHVPTSNADAALSMVDPTGTIRSTVDAVRGAKDTYQSEVQRGNNPVIAGGRAAATLLPGGSTLNALTEPAEAMMHNRPVSNRENVDAAGGVGDIGGQVALGAIAHKIATRPGAPPPPSATPTLDAIDANLGNDSIGAPGKPPYDTTPHGDVINKAVGPGSMNSKRGINVGKAFVDAGVEINPAEVKKNPRALIVHTNKVIAAENMAADQLLQSPEAKQPIANGNVLTKGATDGVALVDAADERAAKAVGRYVDRRIAELSAKHGGGGMLSIADTDTIKRELQNRANYDKIFGNTALTSAGNLRNQLLADYARSFDSFGDTLPDYRELNDRRASLVNFRDNVLHPIVDAKIDGSNVKPSKLGAVAKLGSAAARMNGFDAIKAGVDLAASSAPVADPVRIAKAINQEVRAAKAAGAESPTARILANSQPSPAAPPPSEIRPPAQFAASDRGDVFPIDTRPGQVQASFPAQGGTAGLGWAPRETPENYAASVLATERSATAQRNPGFNPDTLPMSSSGPPRVSTPVSHIDLANTLRGVSSAPGELYPSLLGSTRSAAPGQIGSGLADTLRGGGSVPPSGNEFPRRAGSAIEFPVKGDRDENDALFMHRDGRQFPVPVPPSQLLPPQFENARKVTYGAPLSGDLGGADMHGRYGQRFAASSTPQTAPENTVLIARNATDEPGTYAHEVNHAIYQRDLTPEQKRQFQSAVVNAVNTGAKDKAALAATPKAVIAYANEYPNDHDRAFNEMFAELGAQYMLNPTDFRATYPSWYGMFRQFYGGKEYIQPKKSAGVPR